MVKNNKQVVKVLRNAANGNLPKGMDVSLGVCWLLSDVLYRYDLRRMLEQVVLDWPLFSGLKMYPVPHPDMSAMSAFDRCSNLWVGEYGDNRKDLCTWFADFIEDNLNLNDNGGL